MVRKDWKIAPTKERAKKVIKELAKIHEPVCALHHKNAFELLIATILSAQCTDERVNQVTPSLFERFPDAPSMAQADQTELEEMIRSTGFYRQKTKSVLAVCQGLVDKFDGEVPQDMSDLTALPGIGRKTANVVLGTAYEIPAIMVDTHVKRLSHRLQFSDKKDPDKIEKDLIAIIPEKERTDFSHRLIWHGRKICKAKKPLCGECTIAAFCPSEGMI